MHLCGELACRAAASVRSRGSLCVPSPRESGGGGRVRTDLVEAVLNLRQAVCHCKVPAGEALLGGGDGK